MKIDITEIEIYENDIDADIDARIKLNCDKTVEINLINKIHTIESWLEIASTIAQAIKKMTKEEDEING